MTSKHNYKLGVTQRQDIHSMMRKEHTLKDIVDHVKKKYDISITEGYLSQMKQRLFISELTVYNKDVERKLRKKIKIDRDLLSICSKGYEILHRYLLTVDTDKLTVREVQTIGNIVLNAHRIYTDINKDGSTRGNATYNIKKALGLSPQTPTT